VNGSLPEGRVHGGGRAGEPVRPLPRHSSPHPRQIRSIFESLLRACLSFNRIMALFLNSVILLKNCQKCVKFLWRFQFYRGPYNISFTIVEDLEPFDVHTDLTSYFKSESDPDLASDTLFFLPNLVILKTCCSHFF